MLTSRAPLVTKASSLRFANVQQEAPPSVIPAGAIRVTGQRNDETLEVVMLRGCDVIGESRMLTRTAAMATCTANDWGPLDDLPGER
jgi:hypothetical protein